MTAYRQPRGDGAFELRFGGGLNERDRFNISTQECTEGRNFLLDPTGETLKPRLPQALEGTTPNAGEITGILQLITSSDSVTQVIVSGSAWYDWDGASVFSDVTPPLFKSGAAGARMRGTHWVLDDFLAITDIDRENVLYKWDGSLVSRLKTSLTVGNPQSVDSLTCAGSTATAVATAHGYSTGDLVTIAGANETEYNIEAQLTVSDANTFTYTMTCSTSPATGTITVDKGLEVKAKYGVVHDNRLWLFNITADGTSTPQMALVSAFEDAEDFDNSSRGHTQGGSGLTANDAFFLLSPDGKAFNGAVEFFDVLILSTEEGKLFKLTGSDATDYAFDEYYPGSSSAGDEGIVNTGNDVVYFRRGRVVESLSSTEKFGEVSADDLSFWLSESVKRLCNPIVAYDQDAKKIYFFCSELEGVLVLDKEFLELGKSDEFGKLSPWSLYETNMANKFITKCAVPLRDPLSITEKRRTVFWGDDSGNIYDIRGTAGGGDGGSENVSLYRKTGVLSDLDFQDELTIGRLEYIRNASTPVELVWNWADEYSRETIQFNLKASFGLGDAIFWGGDFYWNETDNYWSAGSVVEGQVSTLGFSVPGAGSSAQLEIQISDVDDYTISRIFV